MRIRLLPAALVSLACSAGTAPPDPDPTPPAGIPTGGVSSRIGGCDIFPADNAWNRDVSGDPVDPGSDALIAAMSPDAALHLDLGTTEEYYGIPYSVVLAYPGWADALSQLRARPVRGGDFEVVRLGPITTC